MPAAPQRRCKLKPLSLHSAPDAFCKLSTKIQYHLRGAGPYGLLLRELSSSERPDSSIPVFQHASLKFTLRAVRDLYT